VTNYQSAFIILNLSYILPESLVSVCECVSYVLVLRARGCPWMHFGMWTDAGSTKSDQTAF
jgi:hypothetical protein